MALIRDHLECEDCVHINKDFSKAFNTLREMKKKNHYHHQTNHMVVCATVAIVWAPVLFGHYYYVSNIQCQRCL